jgi:hypothetical protein
MPETVSTADFPYPTSSFTEQYAVMVSAYALSFRRYVVRIEAGFPETVRLLWFVFCTLQAYSFK